MPPGSFPVPIRCSAEPQEHSRGNRRNACPIPLGVCTGPTGESEELPGERPGLTLPIHGHPVANLRRLARPGSAECGRHRPEVAEEALLREHLASSFVVDFQFLVQKAD